MKLICVDPSRRRWRRYRVCVQPTLLEPYAAVCEWGSLRTKYCRIRSIPCAGQAEAEELAQRIIERKKRRGYREA